MNPLVSVVIPARDEETRISAQLAALARQDFARPWEAIVVDNGSRDRTAASAEEWHGSLPLRLIEAPGPASAGYARNAGAAAAEGELLLFCDADDEVHPDWIRVMCCALQRGPLVAGAVRHDRLNAPALAAAFDPGYSGSPWWGFLASVESCNLGVRRTLFEELGGFQTDYRRGEDTDFCWRAQLAGYPLMVEESAVVDRRIKEASASGLFLTHVREGSDLVRLYLRFREHGMPRSPLRDLVYDYLSIPLLLVANRYRAARVAGWRVGRALGSIRLGVLFL